MPPDGQQTADQGRAAGASADEGGGGALASAIRVVSGLTLISRFAGLARDVVIVRLLSDGALASAFRIAYTLPNLFRRLFGEGALSAAFLPEYTKLRRDDPAVADELASITLKVLVLVTGSLTLILEAGLFLVLLFAPASLTAGDIAIPAADFVSQLHGPPPPDELGAAGWRTTTILMIMLMLPMMPMVCITAILGGMLQAHGRFGPPAAAPIVLNIFQIAASLPFFFGAFDNKLTAAYTVGVAAVAASVAQIYWSLWGLRGLVRWRAAGTAAVMHARKVLRRFIPAALGLGTLQINTMVDQLIATWPLLIGPTMFGRVLTLDEKSNAILSYTQQLYQFPLGVFGLAVATAVFPLLSRACRDENTPAHAGAFAQVLRRGLRLSFFIGLPASAGLALVRHDLIYVVYSGGESGFSAEGVGRAAAVLLGFAPAVWAYSLNHVLTRAFYAKGDTTTPMRIAVAMVGFNITLNLVLIWPLREAGLAWATAISAMVQCVILLTLCKRKLSVKIFDPATLASFAKIACITAVMSAAVVAVLVLWPGGAGSIVSIPSLSPPEPHRWANAAARLAACTAVGVAAYIVLARVLHAVELRWLLERAPKGAKGKDGAEGMSFE